MNRWGKQKSVCVLAVMALLMTFVGGCSKPQKQEQPSITPEPTKQISEETPMEVRNEFFVSPEGNDKNEGTKDSPFQTIERAREEVAKHNQDMTSDIVVYLMDGTYYLEETLIFGPADSGTNGYKVRYEAYDGATPEISGGMELTGVWELHDEEKSIYKIRVPEGLNFRQLYVNGEKAVRARTGQPGVFDISSRIQAAERLGADGNVIPESWENWNDERAQAQAVDGRVIVPISEWLSEDMAGLEQVELHIFTAWCENILRVKSVEKIESYNCRSRLNAYSHSGSELGHKGECYVVYVQEEEAQKVFNRPHPNLDNYVGGPHYVFYYENAYRYMDEAGEWYLDTETDTLYYKAAEGEDMAKASAVVPVLEEIVRIEGTLEQPVTNLEIKGLTFEHSTWLQPSEEGLVNGQAGQYVTYAVFATNNIGVKNIPAGVHIENAKGVRFEGNHVRFMGGSGILLQLGTEKVTVINNVVENIAGNGIEIGKFTVDENTDYHTPYNPENLKEVCTYDRILNNTVHTIGTQYEGSVGIAAGYVKGITIANNTVYNCPYSGISVGYGWTDAENPMEYNRILRNEVYRINQLLCDAGGIYTLSNQEPGSLMAENYLHDNWLPAGADYSSSGIYMDEQTTGYTVLKNVLVSAYGIYMRLPEENVQQSNFIFNKAVTDSRYDEFVTAEIQSIMDNAGVQEDFNEEVLFTPIVMETTYEPGNDIFRMYGTNFGTGAGTVVFETEAETITMSAEQIKTWTEEQIALVLPENVKGNVTVYIVTKEQEKSGAYMTELQIAAKNLVYSENFEEVPEGTLAETEWSVSLENHAAVISIDEGKVLELKGSSPNLEVFRLTSDGGRLSYGSNITQYDFMFPKTMSDYTGLYNQLRIDASGTAYTTNIRPAYSVPLGLEQKGAGESSQLKDLQLKTGVWYTCKTMVYDNMLCISIYERGTEAPGEWSLTLSMPNSVSEDCVLNFSFYDPNGRSVYIDNIVVEGHLK